MMYNLIILQWLLKKGVELLPPYEKGPGIIIPGPYVYQGNMLLNILNVLREIDWDLDYNTILEEIFFKKYDHEQKVLMKKITKKYSLQEVVKYKIEDEDINNETILSLGGDPELPLMHENYVGAFEDSSCVYGAENRFIKPIYILLAKIDDRNAEKTIKAIAEYLFESIKIFKELTEEIFAYEYGNYEDEPYGGHIHIGLVLPKEKAKNKFEIKEYFLTMLSAIGAVKYKEWYEAERHYNDYYGNALHYRSKYDNENTIHIEFRNPPWWVWTQYNELTQIMAAIIIAAKGLTDIINRINPKMDNII